MMRALSFFMEKLPFVLAPSLKPKLAPAVLALLSTVAAACTKTVYVPVYQNFPEDTGYSRTDESDVGVPSEEDSQAEDLEEESEDESIDSGVFQPVITPEECWEAYSLFDVPRLDDSVLFEQTEVDFTLNPIVTFRYDEMYGRTVSADNYYFLLRVLGETDDHVWLEHYCYAVNWANISDSSITVTYDISCGVDYSEWCYGHAYIFIFSLLEPPICQVDSFAEREQWLLVDGIFVNHNDPGFDGFDSCH